jgi:hypothetical protein
VSGTEGPIAPWAFRAALSGLPADEVRDILESDRCPQPETSQDPTTVTVAGEAVVVHQPDTEGAWLRSDQHRSLETMR